MILMDENTFDSSSLNTYVSCPRRYYWRYVRNLLPRDYKAAPLDFGTAIHEALRLWYTNHNAVKAIEAFHDLWDERFADKKRTHEKGIDLLTGYFERYGKRDTFDWISEPECVFKIRFGSCFFVGRFDGVINFQGTPYVIDHKTATRMGSNYFYQFRPDMQMTAYTWAAKQLFPDLDIRGVFLNILYFTTKQMDYHRDTTERQEWEIEEFLDVASRNIAEIRVKNREDHMDWEPRWSYCQHWGTCPYRDLCTEEDPQPLIDTLYREEEWDPEEEFDLDRKKKKLEEYVEEPRLYAVD